MTGYHASLEQFEAAAEFVNPAELNSFVRISADPQQHADWLRQDLELGVERLFLHNVNREQEAFIQTFGAQVLPALK
jgi:hypothetical protein